jgi:hypothetical protein
MGLIKKVVSKRRTLGRAQHDIVYVVTRKEEKIYYEIVGGRHLSLEDF